MSHTVNPTVLRLGYKLNWTFLHNFIYATKLFRITLLINAVLFGFLKRYNYTLVKYFVHLETTKCKILVVALRNFGIGRKLYTFSFFKWFQLHKLVLFNIKRNTVGSHYSITHFKLRLLLRKLDFNKFKIYKNKFKFLKKLKKINVFSPQNICNYIYKKFAKFRLNKLFNHNNNFNLMNLIFNNDIRKSLIGNNTYKEKKFNLLRLYNFYNYNTLWIKNFISNLSSVHFLKTFDDKGFSPFWLKRYKFFKYFGSKSKLFFFKFLTNNKFIKANKNYNYIDSNSGKDNFLFSFINIFFKYYYFNLSTFNFYNYKLIYKNYFYLMDLIYILKKIILFVNFKKNYFLQFLNFFFLKTLFLFNFNVIFFKVFYFFNYYIFNFYFVIKNSNLKKNKTNSKNYFSNLISTSLFSKLYMQKKNDFYSDLTYYISPIEYSKLRLKNLKFKFTKELTLDGHLYNKYNFPFSKNEALSYKMMHDTLLRETHEESKNKVDFKNNDIKYYSRFRRKNYYYLIKNYKKKSIKNLLLNNYFNNYNNNTADKILSRNYLIKKIYKTVNSLKYLNPTKLILIQKNTKKSNFFVSEFCFLLLHKLRFRLKKIINLGSLLNTKTNTVDTIRYFFNSNLNTYFNYFKKLSFFVKTIFFKNFLIANPFFFKKLTNNITDFTLNAKNKSSKLAYYNKGKSNLTFYSIIRYAVFMFKNSLMNSFAFFNYSDGYSNLNKIYSTTDFLKPVSFLIEKNFKKINNLYFFKLKDYNLFFNLINFFYFEKFNLQTFYYKKNRFRHNINLLASGYSNWFIKRKTSFFLEKEFEKIFRLNCNVEFVNPILNFLTTDHGLHYIQSIPFLLDKVYMHPKEKRNMMYFLIIFFLSLKFRVTYLLSTYLTIMIEKREKHFEFFTILKRVMSTIKISEFNLSGLTIGLYGKVNGKDRAYRYFIHKFLKPSVRKQTMILNSELSHCYSRYGVFGVRIWMHEF